jgi:hypothetical protein
MLFILHIENTLTFFISHLLLMSSSFMRSKDSLLNRLSPLSSSNHL